ncbi:MAG TPA: CdaR family protein [Bacillota bacterium]|nr:CdaR family protein [Bacillota bacterium]
MVARFDWRNSSLKLLAVLLAFVLWVYVSNDQNPVREKILTVALEHNDPGGGYLIMGGLPESVKVRVQGNRSQLANLSPVDFRAAVSVPEGKTGDFSLPVQVSAPAGLSVVQVTPEEVRASIDRIVDKQLPVAVSLQGTPAQGFTALAPVYQPPTVTARGPSRVLNEISQATAVINIQSAAKDVDQIAQLSTGSSNVSLNPSSVRVVIPLVSATASKTVSVLPGLTGTPAEGFAVKRSYAAPEAVQVLGPAEAIGQLTSIRTEPVDIQGANKNLSVEVGIIKPEGITAVNPGRVRVQVEIMKTEAPAGGQPGGEQPRP